MLAYGALREDKPNSKLLLQVSNLDIEKLKILARAVAVACGLPAHVDFYPHNSVQLFDYSSRARCLEAVQLLCGGVSVPGSLVKAVYDFVFVGVGWGIFGEVWAASFWVDGWVVFFRELLLRNNTYIKRNSLL